MAYVSIVYSSIDGRNEYIVQYSIHFLTANYCSASLSASAFVSS
jgi:hypothetical protein